MSDKWEVKKESFEIIDVRHLTNNFLPMILQKSQKVDVGKGLCIIQSFDPKPLYSALRDLGFLHKTVKISEHEYRAYFYRKEKRPIKYQSGADMPFKPTAILNYKAIDDLLANKVVDLWEFIWEKEDAAIDQKTKLLLSLSNAVGASRFRQAARELIKVYSLGATVKELDELFSLFAWNQGIGYFSSEIGPSALFGIYKHIKKRESEKIDRKTIIEELINNFGDKNPCVSTFFKKSGKRCPKYDENDETIKD